MSDYDLEEQNEFLDNDEEQENFFDDENEFEETNNNNNYQQYQQITSQQQQTFMNQQKNLSKQQPIIQQTQQKNELYNDDDDDSDEELDEEKIAYKYAREKIEQLDNEIMKFQKESKAIQEGKKKYKLLIQQQTNQLNKLSVFLILIIIQQSKKELVKQEFEQWKCQEIKKMKNEKNIVDRQHKMLLNQPNRKEREEIEQLKKDISKLQEEISKKDQTYKLNENKLKKQIEEVNSKNSMLQESIKNSECQRLQQKVY